MYQDLSLDHISPRRRGCRYSRLSHPLPQASDGSDVNLRGAVAKSMAPRQDLPPRDYGHPERKPSMPQPFRLDRIYRLPTRLILSRRSRQQMESESCKVSRREQMSSIESSASTDPHQHHQCHGYRPWACPPGKRVHHYEPPMKRPGPAHTDKRHARHLLRGSRGRFLRLRK